MSVHVPPIYYANAEQCAVLSMLIYLIFVGSFSVVDVGLSLIVYVQSSRSVSANLAVVYKKKQSYVSAADIIIGLCRV